jgi:hypothetical protein
MAARRRLRPVRVVQGRRCLCVAGVDAHDLVRGRRLQVAGLVTRAVGITDRCLGAAVSSTHRPTGEPTHDHSCGGGSDEEGSGTSPGQLPQLIDQLPGLAVLEEVCQLMRQR